jgi:alpha-1,2-mannosyltransferase
VRAVYGGGGHHDAAGRQEDDFRGRRAHLAGRRGWSRRCGTYAERCATPEPNTSNLSQAAELAVNTLFYRKPVFAAWNIVKYNVLANSGGPELYGTEPWTFYFRNLALNFNIWFALALLSGPLFLIQKALSISKQGFQSGLRTIVFLAPFYMWLAIFTLQPHKEERFMYPAYPLLTLNAAVASHILLVALGSVLHGQVIAKIKFGIVAATLLLSIVAGLTRVYGLYSAYSAPLRIYSPLWDEPSPDRAGQNVCFGKEWYRFPSSYFLPDDMHAKFVRSEFRGILPAEFSEAGAGFGFRSGTWLPTSRLNDRNEPDPEQHTPLAECDYVVDTQYPENTDPLPPLEPDYTADADVWEEAKCVPFLDAARTPALARMVWTPDVGGLPDRLRRRWGRHCLLRRRATKVEAP